DFGGPGACCRFSDSLRPTGARPMFSNDYLALRLLRLKPRETWQSRGTGLCLLFPKGGPGMFASTAINHPLAPGDVLVFWQAQGGKVSAMDAEGLVFWRFSLCL